MSVPRPSSPEEGRSGAEELYRGRRRILARRSLSVGLLLLAIAALLFLRLRGNFWESIFLVVLVGFPGIVVGTILVSLLPGILLIVPARDLGERTSRDAIIGSGLIGAWTGGSIGIATEIKIATADWPNLAPSLLTKIVYWPLGFLIDFSWTWAAMIALGAGVGAALGYWRWGR